jgi:Ca-activated chloride channel family protein
MNDDFDRLAKGLRGMPAPDAQARAAALMAARAAFAQETATRVRPTFDQPQQVGFWKRITPMFARPSLRPALYLTSSLVVVGFGLVLGAPYLTPPTLTEEPEIAASAPAPMPAPAPVSAARTTSRLAAEGFAAGSVPESASVGVTLPDPRTQVTSQVRNRYAMADTNPVRVTAEDPVSTFSIDVDTSGYTILRRALNSGQEFASDAVRIEEMINYFTYDYPTPTGDAPFSVIADLAASPFRTDRQMVRIGLQGAVPLTRPPLDLVFLIDTSGSMQDPDKLPLLVRALKMILPKMGSEDTIAIVTYAGSAGTVLPATAATDRATIAAALDALVAGGGTDGAAGLTEAYRLAAAGHAEGRVGRVMLATDGDFNLGLTGDEGLEDFIARHRSAGTYLSVLGFGWGNLNDGLMQTLAQAGNGNAAYIDTLSEARRVLVDAFAAGLVPIADDVKIQVEFNPATVADYRLIGYETRALARTDFNNDRVDAGEIGAGHQVTALYEITPAGSPARAADPLRYGNAVARDTSGEIAQIKLRYKPAGAAQSMLMTQILMQEPQDADTDFRFAMAIAEFGDWLRDPIRSSDALDPVIALALDARGTDPMGLRAEAIDLMRLARATRD